MITEETTVSTELIAQMTNMIYSIIISEFIAYSNDEVKSKIANLINEEMESIRYALLNEHADIALLRERHKIYENLRKEL
jgi:hypothetical protein